MEDTGVEPVTFGLQDRRSAKNELIPHILQNISRANYLHSAETLLSWSAEPLHFPTKRELNRIRDATGYVFGFHQFSSIISIKLHILLIYRIFQLFLRADSSPSVAPK